MVVGELKHCKYYALSQDAGHRVGLEHLIKMISYPWVDKNGNHRIRNFCLDMDTCGKTTLEMAAGINKSLRRLERLTSAKCIGATGDSGGGGAIQNIIKPLVANNTLLPWAKHIRCLLHALNKCFKRAVEASMGKQGLGTNSCIQLLYASITMFRKIIV